MPSIDRAVSGTKSLKVFSFVLVLSAAFSFLSFSSSDVSCAYRPTLPEIKNRKIIHIKIGWFLRKTVELPMLNVDIIEKLISRSEEHTSELQSRGHLVCRLLLYFSLCFLYSFPTRRSSDLCFGAVRCILFFVFFFVGCILCIQADTS